MGESFGLNRQIATVADLENAIVALNGPANMLRQYIAANAGNSNRLVREAKDALDALRDAYVALDGYRSRFHDAMVRLGAFPTIWEDNASGGKTGRLDESGFFYLWNENKKRAWVTDEDRGKLQVAYDKIVVAIRDITGVLIFPDELEHIAVELASAAVSTIGAPHIDLSKIDVGYGAVTPRSRNLNKPIGTTKDKTGGKTGGKGLPGRGGDTDPWQQPGRHSGDPSHQGGGPSGQGDQQIGGGNADPQHTGGQQQTDQNNQRQARDEDGDPEVENTPTDQDGEVGVTNTKTETHVVDQYTDADGNTVIVEQTTTTVETEGSGGGFPDPGGDASGGSESKPAIPYGPHHDSGLGGGYSPEPPDDAQLHVGSPIGARILSRRLMRYGVSGYASGDDLGAAGDHPRFDPDPDNSGGSGTPSVSGDTLGVGQGVIHGGDASSGAPTVDNESLLIGPSGPDPDNEWGAGGYNPHYQPAGGYVWTPYSRGGAVGTTRATPVLPARVQRLAAMRFK